MTKYKKPVCDCGSNNLRFIEIKLSKLEWKIDDNGQFQNDLISEEPLDTEDEYLLCLECGLKHSFEIDNEGRTIR